MFYYFCPMTGEKVCSGAWETPEDAVFSAAINDEMSYGGHGFATITVANVFKEE